MKFGAKLGPIVGKGKQGTIYKFIGFKISPKTKLKHTKNSKYIVKYFNYMHPEVYIKQPNGNWLLEPSKKVQSLPRYLQNNPRMLQEQIENTRNEIENQIKASEIGIAPKIFAYDDYHIVMEYIKGQTLEEYLDTHFIEENQKVIKDTKKVIKKLHKIGIVHNDLFPFNIIVSEDSKIYLIDFGDSYNNSTQKDFDNDYLML